MQETIMQETIMQETKIDPIIETKIDPIIETLYNAPCFIVSIDRCIERYDFARKNVENAGFCNIERFKGVDAKVDDLKKAWEVHGSPIFETKHVESEDFTEKHKGKQGCMLSHLNLWKHIIDNKINVATIFEDDVRFHKEWDKYAQQYFKNTPNDYHILYLGSQLQHVAHTPIAIVPVYCTHAYVITYEVAQILYDLIVNRKDGIYTIDSMLIDMMWEAMYNQKIQKFIWYVWNGNVIPDTYRTNDPSKQKRNQGLVFQDDQFESEVKVYEFGKA